MQSIIQGSKPMLQESWNFTINMAWQVCPTIFPGGKYTPLTPKYSGTVALAVYQLHEVHIKKQQYNNATIQQYITTLHITRDKHWL